MRLLHGSELFRRRRQSASLKLTVLTLRSAHQSPSMAQQNNGCATGCGTLLALMALGVVLAYWPVFLAIGLVALLLYAFAVPGLQQKQRQLKALVEVSQRRVRQDPCQVREHFGIVQSITLAGDLFTP